MVADSDAAIEFLRVAFDPDDWIALFLKSYETGRCMQRVGPGALFREPRVHAWLRAMNAQRFNIYVSVNAIRPGTRRRTKDAIAAVRHVFVEADQDGPAVVERIASHRDLPSPSYLMHSSPNRVHVLWRTAGFTSPAVERLQKHLASALGTDLAATPCSQTTRLPGYLNHKYRPSHVVTVDYGPEQARYGPEQFPSPPPTRSREVSRMMVPRAAFDVVERARRYLSRTEPAIAGQHGDLQTFKICCRLVRGFALTDAQALGVLAAWNKECQPPWSEKDLCDKLSRARRYGSERVGGMV